MQILKRDNFTCQNINCKTFNPLLGQVKVPDENGDILTTKILNSNGNCKKDYH